MLLEAAGRNLDTRKNTRGRDQTQDLSGHVEGFPQSGLSKEVRDRVRFTASGQHGTRACDAQVRGSFDYIRDPRQG